MFDIKVAVLGVGGALTVLSQTDGKSEHIVGGSGMGKGEWTVHVMGTLVTHMEKCVICYDQQQNVLS